MAARNAQPKEETKKEPKEEPKKEKVVVDQQKEEETNQQKKITWHLMILRLENRLGEANLEVFIWLESGNLLIWLL